jgi:hypothetical protein
MNAKQRLAAPLRGRSPASAVYAAGAARLLLARKPKKSDADLKPTPNRGNVGQVRAKIVTRDRYVMLQMAEVAACGGSSEILALIGRLRAPPAPREGRKVRCIRRQRERWPRCGRRSAFQRLGEVYGPVRAPAESGGAAYRRPRRPKGRSWLHNQRQSGE